MRTLQGHDTWYSIQYSEEVFSGIRSLLIFENFTIRTPLVIFNVLFSVFLPTGDYLNQVLMPEFLIRVYMSVHGTTHEESDRLMAATPFKIFDITTHL